MRLAFYTPHGKWNKTARNTKVGQNSMQQPKKNSKMKIPLLPKNVLKHVSCQNAYRNTSETPKEPNGNRCCQRVAIVWRSVILPLPSSWYSEASPTGQTWETRVVPGKGESSCRFWGGSSQRISHPRHRGSDFFCSKEFQYHRPIFIQH